MTEWQLRLLRIIEDNPGIRFRSIMRLSGMKNGVLTHHLRRMERAGRIRVMRGPRQTSYSSPGINEDQLRVACALQRSTPRAILLALAAEDGLRFSNLVDRCKRSPSTISLYLTGMTRDGLVAVYKFRSNSYLYLTGDLRQMLPGVTAYGVQFDLNLYVAVRRPESGRELYA